MPGSRQTVTVSDPSGVALGGIPAWNGSAFETQSPIPVLTNAVTNGNFANGATGWVGDNGSSISAASSVLSVSGTGLQGYTYARNDLATPIVAGRRYYVAATLKQTVGTLAISLAVRLGGSIGAGYATTVAVAPVLNVSYRLSATCALPSNATGNLKVYPIALFANAAAASGAVFEVRDVMCIDLTAAFGAGNEPSQAEMDAYLARYTNSWFDSTTPQLWSGSDWLKRTQNSCRNLVTNGDFSNGATGWDPTTATLVSVTGSELVYIATAANGRYAQQLNHVLNRKYYYCGYVKATSNLVKLDISGVNLAAHSGSGAYEFLSGVWTATGTTGYLLSAQDFNTGGWANVSQKYMLAIDLTATFGAGNEPTKSEMDRLLSKYPNSWFNGHVNDLLSPVKTYSRFREGVGSPENVVTAPVGTVYTDVAATCGAIQWTKFSGTGNSGWVVTNGNTGLRTLAEWDTSGVFSKGSLPAGWKVRPGIAGSVKVRRAGDQTAVFIEHVACASANTTDSIVTLPAGFTATSTEVNHGRPLAMFKGGNPTFVAFRASIRREDSMTFAVDDYIARGIIEFNSAGVPWPTTLP